MTQGGERFRRDKPWRERNSMWLLPTIACCGLLTWASFLYIGIRSRRSTWLAAATAYGLATLAYLAVVGSAPRAADGTVDTSGWQGTAGTVFLLVVWVGGCVHALIINRQWLDFLATQPEPMSARPAPPAPPVWPGAPAPPPPAYAVPNAPPALDEPWRTFVAHALASQRDIVASVANTSPGPMRERLQLLAGHVDTGLRECWQLAQDGQRITRARLHINTPAIATELRRLQALAPSPSLTETAEALQAQLDTATRLEGQVTSTYDGLLLLNARLGEAAARVIELSVRPHQLNDVAAVESTVESVVDELAAIRHGLTELDS